MLRKYVRTEYSVLYFIKAPMNMISYEFLSHVCIWFLTEPITKQSDALSNFTCIGMSCYTEQNEDDLIERKDCKKACSESGNIINL